ncbi:MAG: hypothetical protein LUO79_07190 [Methanomassiliicoccales archaeon]|nr:hypothetical protein [Methanomassiliicoccales archaeon]
MDQSASLAFGIVIGIVMIWVGVIVGIASRAVIKGELTSKDNYRPFQPKFVKKLTEQEADAINRRFSVYLLSWALSMILAGIASIFLGALNLGDYVLFVLLIAQLPVIALIPIAYYAAYKVAKAKDEPNAAARALK